MKNEVVDRSWQELAREAQLEREEFRCKVIEQSAEIERLKRYSLIVESYLDRETLKEVLTKYRATPDGRTHEPCEQHPTIYILSFGSYSDRFVFSVHSTREKAIAVHRLTEAESTRPQPLDIEEYELDPDLCVVCGYEADNSSAHKNHAFISGRSAQKPQDASSGEKP